MFGTIDQAYDMGAAAVGATIYLVHKNPIVKSKKLPKHLPTHMS